MFSTAESRLTTAGGNYPELPEGSPFFRESTDRHLRGLDRARILSLMKTTTWNVRIEVTNVDGLSHALNVPTAALSANHAKGAAQYATQMKNPGCRTQVVDCYRIVSLADVTPVAL